MAEIFRIQAKDAVLRINHYDAINAVQNFNWDPAFNEENKEELGNAGYAGTSYTPEITASFDATTTGASYALLSRMIKTFAAGEFTGYMAGTPATADNTGYITEVDLDNCVADLILAKKANEVFTRSEHLSRVYLDSISWSVSVDGDATETYNFSGDLGEVYQSPQHDLLSIPLTRVSGSEDTDVITPAGYEIDITGTPASGEEWVLVHIDQEGERVLPASLTRTLDDPDTSPDSGDETTQFTAAAGTWREGTRIHAVIYKYTPGSFPSIVNLMSAVNFLQADAIDILFVDPSVTDIKNLVRDLQTHTLVDNAVNGNTEITFTSAEYVLRGQSADINVDLGREALRQIKQNNLGTSIYYRAATYPLNIEATVNTLESDLAQWARLQSKTSTDVLNLADFEGETWQIVIRYWYGTQVIQAIAVLDARVTGRSASIGVGGNSEIAWSFSGALLLVEGTELS